jgi:nicotinamidase-related amidase
MRVKREDVIGLVIDLQERLLPHIHDAPALESRVVRLIQGLATLEIPLLVTEQYRKGLGATVPAIADALRAGGASAALENAVDKLSFSAVGDKGFLEQLRARRKKFVLLFGVETHVCVLQTALDLIDLDFIPVLIEDCSGSRQPEDRRIAIERMRAEGVIITSAESILFELCRVAGTAQFKALSQLVK